MLIIERLERDKQSKTMNRRFSL